MDPYSPASNFEQRQLTVTRRARAEMRAGQPLVVTTDDASWLMVAAECLHGACLDRAQAYGIGTLYITAPRARALGRPTADGIVELAAPLKSELIHTIIDPIGPRAALDLVAWSPLWHDQNHPAAFAIDLAKQAGLLPAVWLVELSAEQARTAHRDELLHIACQPSAARHATSPLIALGSTRVPLAAAPNTRVYSFRGGADQAEHLALVINQPDMANAPLVRLHSSCLTGDILGSLRCDCGPQLQAAIGAMNNAGGGIVLYLQQEGRGIGLINKLRAYQLQDTGLDTYDANQALGFDNDERDFQVAAQILKHLGVTTCRLMTNNPRKITQLAQYGVTVSERLPLTAGANDHNAKYLAAKKDKGGHLLRDEKREARCEKK